MPIIVDFLRKKDVTISIDKVYTYEVIQYGIDNGLTRLEIDGEVHAY